MNLEEVARRAGVSTATVSRVLNGLDVVRGSTRERVLKVVADLNYHPNLHARSLAGGKSKTLGMVVSNLENPFFLDVYRALEEKAHEGGYEVVVANTQYRPEQLVRSVRLMIGRRVAGLAVVVSEMAPDVMQELTASRIGAVFYDVGTAAGHISNIRVNYRRGIEQVVEYLHGLGHRRLAFAGHHSTLGPTSEREEAFRETVARYGPETTWRTVADQDGLDGGRAAARELLRTGEPVTGIICVNDLMAVGVLRELRERGLRVPEDVSVTGFDNIQLAEYCRPQLTTLNIPRERVGRLMYEALVKDEGKSGGQEIMIDPEMVVRESTGPAPGRTVR